MTSEDGRPTYRLSAQERLHEAVGHLRQGGKATRARCVQLVGSVFGAEPSDPQILRFGEAIELLHLGTLIHDDILDGADVRRGKPAVHVAFGSKVAVLAGDLAVSHSGRMIAEFDRTRLSRRFAETLAELCEGELVQDDQIWNPSVTMAAYLDRLAKKTGGLFELAAEGAALLAGSSEEAADRAGRFGRDLGCLFQMVDDLLDGSVDSAVLGKPAGRDLDAGCLTLKAVLALSDDGMGPQVHHYLTESPSRDLASLHALLESRELAERAVQVLDAMGRMTLDALRGLPAGAPRSLLEGLVEQLWATGKAAAMGAGPGGQLSAEALPSLQA